MLELQRVVGNRLTVAMLGADRVLPKLTVGRSDDPLEHDADLLGRQIAQQWTSGAQPAGPDDIGPLEADEPGPTARRSPAVGPGGGAEAPPEVVGGIRERRGTGEELPEPLRRALAPAADLGDVRVHRDRAADTMAGAVQAEAFTVGNDVFFREGAYDPSSAAGRELIGHEVAHVLQQSGGSIRRKKAAKAPTANLDPIEDWLAYSNVKGKPRSKALKAIDAALGTWRTGGRQLRGLVDRNIQELQAIMDAIDAWKATKKGVSYRDLMVQGLVDALTPVAADFAARRDKKLRDEAVAAPLFDEFKKIDANTAQFAGKNLTDINQARFEPDRQTAGLMAHTKKNPDGSLTEEAMASLDEEQIEEARALVKSARNARIEIDPSVDLDALREAAEKDANELTGRSQFPELKNLTDPNEETDQDGEVTEDLAESGSTVHVTYDKSDVHAAERLASLRRAIALINATRARVPELDVYFPKLGRSIAVGKDCQIKVTSKIADAVFHPPRFLAVSSANTGVAKTDRSGGELKFLSAALGADQALVHTIIHEIGHALHYHNARGQFYNLNFAYFKGRNADGRSFQEIAQREVSAYGSNPREMVAEVFVGAVTGKKRFSDDVWEIYVGLGGFDPR